MNCSSNRFVPGDDRCFAVPIGTMPPFPRRDCSSVDVGGSAPFRAGGIPRRELLRMMMEEIKTVALVFSGGFGLGAYHAGAYEAFSRSSQPLHWITGSSAG